MKIDSIIEKLKKLKSLADPTRNPNPGECERAMEMYYKLLREHNLSESQIETKEHNDPSIIRTSLGTERWQLAAIRAIAKLYYCYYYVLTEPGGKQKSVHLVGMPHNLLVAHDIIEWILQCLHKEANRLYFSHDSKRKTAFKLGAAERLEVRVNQIIRAERTDNDSLFTGERQPSGKNELMVMRKNLHDTNLKFMEEIGIEFISEERVVPESLEAYENGMKYGNKISLNRQIGEPQQKKRIGGT